MANKRILEDEIDAVRVDFYDKTKNMTSDERIAYIRDQTASVHSKFAIRTIIIKEPFDYTKSRQPKNV